MRAEEAKQLALKKVQVELGAAVDKAMSHIKWAVEQGEFGCHVACTSRVEMVLMGQHLTALGYSVVPRRGSLEVSWL